MTVFAVYRYTLPTFLEKITFARLTGDGVSTVFAGFRAEVHKNYLQPFSLPNMPDRISQNGDTLFLKGPLTIVASSLGASVCRLWYAAGIGFLVGHLVFKLITKDEKDRRALDWVAAWVNFLVIG